MAKRTPTGTVPSSGRGGTAAATAQNEQTGRRANSSKPPGHAQRMLGGQQWRASVVAQSSAAVWLTGDV